MDILRGQRQKVSDIVGGNRNFVVGVRADGPFTADFSLFGLDASGKLAGDEFMVFYNQPQTPCGGVRFVAVGGDAGGFEFSLSRLAPRVERLVITAAIDGAGTMSQMQQGHLRILDGTREVARFGFKGSDFAAERALMIAEFYRKDGIWRFSAVGQGFNGGLEALVRHFGGEVSDSPSGAVPASSPARQSPAPAVSAAEAKRVSLEKRIEREAPQLVSLVKQAKVSLAKAGLSQHTAKVALCLDVSGSMSNLYKTGAVQALAQRVLALGCRFDDDGEIDIFIFADQAKYVGGLNIGNFKTALANVDEGGGVGYGTDYAEAIQLIENHYFGGKAPIASSIASGANRLASWINKSLGQQGRPSSSGESGAIPVYVMFLTDGDTSGQEKVREAMRRVSHRPMFWQFMAIGSPGQFGFLNELDTMTGRYVDNANFFCVGSPSEHSDEKLFDLLMGEYPQWVKEAGKRGLIG